MNKFDDIQYLLNELVTWLILYLTSMAVPNEHLKKKFKSTANRNCLICLPVIPLWRAVDSQRAHAKCKTTQTFTVDIYCRRGETGNKMKEETFKAIRELSDFISDIFKTRFHH